MYAMIARVIIFNLNLNSLFFTLHKRILLGITPIANGPFEASIDTGCSLIITGQTDINKLINATSIEGAYIVM